jgi:nucleoid-associated protein YgaU
VRRLAASICLACLLAACATPPVVPTWRARVVTLVAELDRQDASRLFPQEYGNLVEAFEHGEAVLHVQGDDEEADSYYLLALQKGEVLTAELRRFKEQQAEQERLRLAEQKARAEEERLMREAAQAEQRLRSQEHAKQSAEESKAGGVRGGAQAREHAPAPTSYTVRRGETLPQIAARNEIYNDASLWPLIYRANRDQIRDPKQL